MKKTLLMILSVLMIASLIVSVSAADDASAKVLEKFKEVCPEKYYDIYLGQAENILNSVEITDEQANELVAILNDANSIYVDKGASLEAYNSTEQAKAIEYFKEACDILDVTAVMENNTSTAHEGDAYYKIYKNDGTLIGTVDGDPVKVTGGTSESFTMVFFGIAALAAAVASAVVIKKREF